MRELFNQGRAVSPSAVRSGLRLFTLLSAGLAVLVALAALRTLFAGSPGAALIQLVGGAALLLALYLVVVLLSEILWTLARLNDRLTILGDDLRASLEARPPHSAQESADMDVGG